MFELYWTVIPMLISLVFTALILKYLIPVLKGLKMGQKILDIGPRWHKDKEGTPTMGGVSFLFTVIVVSIGFGVYFLRKGEDVSALFISLVYALLNGFIGVIDDMKKFKRKRNEGLSARQKYLLQLAVAAIYLIFMTRIANLDTILTIPFTQIQFDFSYFYYFIALLILTGVGNAVNLTDGIDGLCGSVTAVVSVLLFAISLRDQNQTLTIMSSALFGGCIGFLIFNLHPAKVFMGDTGSLFLGAMVASMAFISGNELLLFIFGFVYIFEAISVIIQVGFFKIHGKRVFLMAPFHHHLEKKGYSEYKIVVLALFVTTALSLLSYFWG